MINYNQNTRIKRGNSTPSHDSLIVCWFSHNHVPQLSACAPSILVHLPVNHITAQEERNHLHVYERNNNTVLSMLAGRLPVGVIPRHLHAV